MRGLEGVFLRGCFNGRKKPFQKLSDFGREKGKKGKGKKVGRAGIVQGFSLGREIGNREM